MAMSEQAHKEAVVPCGDCHACCRSFRHIRLDPDRDDLTVLQHDRRADGTVWLKIVDRVCAHLKDGRCSVYDKRPVNCRIFDCRKWAETWDDLDPSFREHNAELKPVIAEGRARLKTG